MDDFRNPYLILGLPYGADAKAANRAFARASRRARRSESPHTVEDLTWALHEIEKAEADPESSVQYFRLPADAAALAVPGGEPPTPPPTPMPRTTPVEGVEDRRRQVAERAARQVVTSALSTLEIPTDDPYGVGVSVVAGKPPPVQELETGTAAAPPLQDRRNPVPVNATKPSSGAGVRIGRPRWQAPMLWAAAAFVTLITVIVIGIQASSNQAEPNVAAQKPATGQFSLAELQSWVGQCATYESKRTVRKVDVGAPCKKGNYRVVDLVLATDSCPSGTMRFESDDIGDYALCLRRLRK